MAAVIPPNPPVQPAPQPPPPADKEKDLITRLFQATVPTTAAAHGVEAKISSYSLHLGQSASFVVTIGTKAYRITTGEVDVIRGIKEGDHPAVERWANAVTQLVQELSKTESQGIKNITFLPGADVGYIKIDNKKFEISQFDTIRQTYDVYVQELGDQNQELADLNDQQKVRYDRKAEIEKALKDKPKPANKNDLETELREIVADLPNIQKDIAEAKAEIARLEKEIHLIKIAEIILQLYQGLNLAGAATVVQPAVAGQQVPAPPAVPPAPPPAPQHPNNPPTPPPPPPPPPAPPPAPPAVEPETLQEQLERKIHERKPLPQPPAAAPLPDDHQPDQPAPVPAPEPEQQEGPAAPQPTLPLREPDDAEANSRLAAAALNPTEDAEGRRRGSSTPLREIHWTSIEDPPSEQK